MKTYHIFHAVNPCFEEVEDQQRKYVGSVEATCLEEAYFKTQNFDRYWNKYKPCRSTSIGDIIQQDDVDFMVAGVGFTMIVRNHEND